MVDVVGNTSTFALSSESSCHPDVLSSSIISSTPDVPDVTEPNRHDLIDNLDVVNDNDGYDMLSLNKSMVDTS